jgi:hypothetical protein
LGKRSINGEDFLNMAVSGADWLHRHAQQVNALNVFPVPDGDTGTNMSLTMNFGVKELKEKASARIGTSAEVLSKGLLMGARGNSGVILSQLFRGFAKGVAGRDEISAADFAAALRQGVDTAYQAVVKPVEGTILTVAREAADHAVKYARRTSDIAELMRETLRAAEETLAKTPDLLPLLKQVGVVDSGGQGLVYIYEGFLRALEGESTVAPTAAEPDAKPAQPGSAPKAAQAQLSTEDIEFPYDMEFFIRLNRDAAFDEAAFREYLARDGDSILVIADGGDVKVHVHSRAPGDVLNRSLVYGELTQIQILNMREQHRELIAGESDAAFAEDETPDVAGESAPVCDYGVISVAVGEGIANIFQSLGANIVLSGGQTMNPSTEDFVKAIHSLSARHIFILPNNSNIVMAARQAQEYSDKPVTVIPAKTVQQGLAALLAFNPEADAQENELSMSKAAGNVKSGQVTRAVRDTRYDDIDIISGHYIGIFNDKIVASSERLSDACRKLLSEMIGPNDELVTILCGADADEDSIRSLSEWLESAYPEIELEIRDGGQPLYPYLISVE